MNDDVTVIRTTVTGREDEVRELLRKYFVEATSHGREWFDDQEFGLPVEQIIPDDVDRLATAAIEEPLFLALGDDRPVGTVQLKRLTDATAEVKRLYARPEVRGEGVGRALVETMVDEAAADGFDRLVLGVAPYHESAQALYQSVGFEFRPPYEGTQASPELHDDWNFMERSL